MSRLPQLLLLLFTACLVGCDHVTKEVAVQQLQSDPRVLLGGLLQFTYAENHDMAFGLLSNWLGAVERLWLLTGAKLIAVAGGLYFLAFQRESASLLQKFSVALITAGAAGNLIDRVSRGFVVDFIRIPHWPVFNIADIVIVVGFVLLFAEGFLTTPRSCEASELS